MVSKSGQQWWLAAAFAVVFAGLGTGAAQAQSSISFSGGGSVDPEQFYGGVAWESPDIGGRFRLRPGIDGGVGDGLRLATINVDISVRFPLGQTGWSLVQGGGPVIAIARFDDELVAGETEVTAGVSYLFGFAHDNGFFAEFRTGGGGWVPAFKFGAGWSIKIR